jgi:hypothetical protein
MFKEDSQLNEQIKRAIRQRACRALTKDDLVRAVFDSFKSQKVDLRHVTLEEMKQALVEAARAAKDASGPMAA